MDKFTELRQKFLNVVDNKTMKIEQEIKKKESEEIKRFNRIHGYRTNYSSRYLPLSR